MSKTGPKTDFMADYIPTFDKNLTKHCFKMSRTLVRTKKQKNSPVSRASKDKLSQSFSVETV